MPFGLQIHMAAAHGPNNVKHQLGSTEAGSVSSPIGGKRGGGGNGGGGGGKGKRRRGGRPFGKKSGKPARPPKRF
jgi:hypothetical protein